MTQPPPPPPDNLNDLGRRLRALEQEKATIREQLAATANELQNERQKRHVVQQRLDAVAQQAATNQQMINNPPPAPAPAPAVNSAAKAKLNSFSNGQNEDWLVWKHHFQQCRRLNRYTEEEARLALAAAMQGRAAAAVMDIPVVVANSTANQLLREYENRFLPASASQLSRVQFEQVSQGPKETILDFHARLRQLWNKAYPDLQDDTMLIRKFSLGLRRADVRRQVIRTNPATYGAALEAAQNEASVAQVCSVTETGAGAAEPMEIGAVLKKRFGGGKKVATMDKKRAYTSGGSTGKKNGPCHFCGKSGHWKNECRLLIKAKSHLAGKNRGATGPRGNGGWKKHFPPKRSVHAMGSVVQGRMIALIEELVPAAELDEMSIEDFQALAEELGEVAPEIMDDHEDPSPEDGQDHLEEACGEEQDF